MSDIVEWLRAYANRTTVIDVKRLEEAAAEIERLRADADFNYMHGYESAKSDYRDQLIESEAEIERLRAALEPFACRCSQKGEGAGGTCLAPGGICRAWNARAELEGK